MVVGVHLGKKRPCIAELNRARVGDFIAQATCTPGILSVEHAFYYLSLAQINGHMSAKQELAQGMD